MGQGPCLLSSFLDVEKGKFVSGVTIKSHKIRLTLEGDTSRTPEAPPLVSSHMAWIVFTERVCWMHGLQVSFPQCHRVTLVSIPHTTLCNISAHSALDMQMSQTTLESMIFTHLIHTLHICRCPAGALGPLLSMLSNPDCIDHDKLCGLLDTLALLLMDAGNMSIAWDLRALDVLFWLLRRVPHWRLLDSAMPVFLILSKAQPNGRVSGPLEPPGIHVLGGHHPNVYRAHVSKTQSVIVVALRLQMSGFVALHSSCQPVLASAPVAGTLQHQLILMHQQATK